MLISCLNEGIMCQVSVIASRKYYFIFWPGVNSLCLFLSRSGWRNWKRGPENLATYSCHLLASPACCRPDAQFQFYRNCSMATQPYDSVDDIIYTLSWSFITWSTGIPLSFLHPLASFKQEQFSAAEGMVFFGIRIYFWTLWNQIPTLNLLAGLAFLHCLFLHLP